MNGEVTAFAVALTVLPAMGPARLAALLRRWGPEEAWARVRAGRVGGLGGPDAATVAAAWREAARSIEPSAVARAHRAAGVGVHVLGELGYPPALAGDHEPPGVLFSRGDTSVIEGRRVAVVGTRASSRYGRDVAFGLGRDLAAAGVRVVSGLALGIDGAAHSGALASSAPEPGPPVAVVGSGLDMVYPRAHARLWQDVARRGVILSEAPLGAAPERWRFPVRNRIIAALAEIVVVAESPHAGGSRHTVEAALARATPVMAVPGPVCSPGSELPNALLAEGCHPARDALDVLVALDLQPQAAARAGPVPAPVGAEAVVLEAVGWQRSAFEQVVVAAGRSPMEVSVALARLERDGWVVGEGGWWERCADRRSTG